MASYAREVGLQVADLKRLLKGRVVTRFQLDGSSQTFRIGDAGITKTWVSQHLRSLQEWDKARRAKRQHS